MERIEVPIKSDQFQSLEFGIDSSIQEENIDLFLSWLLHETDEGKQLNDGQKIEYGFTPFELHAEETSLVLRAPDLSSFPMETSNNITNALLCFDCHQGMPQRYGLEANIPRANQTVIVSREFENKPVLLTRSETDNDSDNSGWFIASRKETVDIADEDNLMMMKLYEAAMKAPHLLCYLSMPAGTQITLDEDSVQVFYKNELREKNA
jgi:hypothetical protein